MTEALDVDILRTSFGLSRRRRRKSPSLRLVVGIRIEVSVSFGVVLAAGPKVPASNGAIAMTVTAPGKTRHSPFETNELRYEGRAKVSGAAAYSADASRPGMLWAAFVTSPLAHARIARIDAQAAREMPGVHAVLTGADIGEHFLGRALFDWPVLPTDVVRFIGQYVVAVAAETREGAQAAARAVDVQYEELPAIFDPEEEALADESTPLLHPHPERYPFIIPGKRRPVPHPNMQGYLSETQGDPEAAFTGAHRIFEHRFHERRERTRRRAIEVRDAGEDRPGAGSCTSSRPTNHRLPCVRSWPSPPASRSNRSWSNRPTSAVTSALKASRSMSSCAIFWPAKQAARSKPCVRISTTCARQTCGMPQRYR